MPPMVLSGHPHDFPWLLYGIGNTWEVFGGRGRRLGEPETGVENGLFTAKLVFSQEPRGGGGGSGRGPPRGGLHKGGRAGFCVRLISQRTNTFTNVHEHSLFTNRHRYSGFPTNEHERTFTNIACSRTRFQRTIGSGLHLGHLEAKGQPCRFVTRTCVLGKDVRENVSPGSAVAATFERAAC